MASRVGLKSPPVTSPPVWRDDSSQADSYTRKVSTPSISDPLVGRLVDRRYEIHSRIARGGMATVYLATDLRLERQVAVKVMHNHLADDEQFTARFIREARSSARLAHPNVVGVFDQGQDQDSVYLVMEYLPGMTLRELLQNHGSLTPVQTLDITEAILSGLSAAHKAGIVHRDLKPENVLLADDGRIKIGDFGLARAASANTATGAALLGTIAYLSPELVTRGIADARSDIYAVGIMMYEMLTGKQPYTGEQPMQIAYQHANDTVPPPSNAAPRIPAELDELVLWATARNPQERPRDAGLMLSQLHDTEALLTTAIPTDQLPVQKTKILAPHTSQATAETQLLASPTPEIATPTNAKLLSTRAKKRTARGWLLLLFVLLLTGVAGGSGWWFGPFGPAGQVNIPYSLQGMSEDAARDALTALGLEAATETVTSYSLETEPGRVINTDPLLGTSIRRGTPLTLTISLGPEPTEIGSLLGLTLAEAQDAILNAGLLPEEAIVYQFTNEDRGLVLSATANEQDISAGAASGKLLKGQKVSLVVSAGQLPELGGDSIVDATARLTQVGLVVDSAVQYSTHESIPADAVIGIIKPDGALRPGDQVILLVSTGPPPVPVPEIVGKTWAEARELLGDTGLGYAYWNGTSESLATVLPSLSRVVEIDPAAGALVPPKSIIRVRLAAG